MSKTKEYYDLFAGLQLKKRRRELGYTQETLAKRVNISPQQIQKYENATNRMSVSMISYISSILFVSPSYFFDIDNKVDSFSETSFHDASWEIINLIHNFSLLSEEDRESVISFISTKVKSNIK